MNNSGANAIPYSIGDAIFKFLHLPGGISFLWRLIGWLAVLGLVIMVLLGAPIIGAYVDVFEIALVAGEELKPEEISKMVGAMFSIMGFILLLGLSFWALIASAETAFHKNIFHEFDGGVFPLRLGIAELRVALAQFIVNLICQGVYMAGYFVFILIVLIAVAIGQAGAIGVAIGGIIGFCGFVAWMGSMAYVAVRLAPTAALSVRDDKVTVIDGWKVTKGKALPMFLSYLIVIGLSSIIMLILFGLSMFPLSGAFSGLSELEGANEDDVAAFFKNAWEIIKRPGVMIPFFLISFVYFIVSLLMYTANWGIASYAALIDKQDLGAEFS